MVIFMLYSFRDSIPLQRSLEGNREGKQWICHSNFQSFSSLNVSFVHHLCFCIHQVSISFLFSHFHSPSFFPGTFEFDPLSQFVVFEIPTFLLFSAVIIAIYSWVKIVSFDMLKDTVHRHIGLVLSLIFVWSLWIIVTVVYAEVILGEFLISKVCVSSS